MGDTVKNLPQFTEKFDGSSLRIAIVHARWNKLVIDALIAGAVTKLKEAGVKEHNIAIQSVPGSFELPLACQRCAPVPHLSLSPVTNGKIFCRVIAGSLVQAGASATDLLGGLGIATPRSATPVAGSAASLSTTFPPIQTPHNRPFDAVIAIGVLIKGETMHFEYISESVSHALMRVQLDSGVPVIFGVLTALSEEQALQRAGIGRATKGHNHGEDWGAAAVEMASRVRRWGEGKF